MITQIEIMNDAITELNEQLNAKRRKESKTYKKPLKTIREEAIRRSDRDWATNAFPNQWRDQFEIHHDKVHGMRCLFLTKREHVWRHQRKC